MKKNISLLRNFFDQKFKREALISVIGMLMEYYSIFISGYVDPLLRQEFFSEKSFLLNMYGYIPTVSILVGACLCGYYGDRYGRRKSIAWTVSLVAIPTFLISICPTFAQIGILSSIMVILLRAIQTAAFSGDIVGLVTFLLEESPSNQRGKYGGYMSMGSGLGVALAVLVVANIRPINQNSQHWQWRIPMALAIFGLLVAIYFIRRIKDTATFAHYKKTHKLKNPFYDIFNNYKKMLASVICVTSLAPVITVVIFGFVPYLSMRYYQFSENMALGYSAFSLILFSALAPVFGYVSDIYGRKPILFIVFTSLIILCIYVYLFANINHSYVIVVLQILFAIISSAYYGVTFALVVEHFPTHIRYTSVAFGYAITYVIFGNLLGKKLEDWLIDLNSSGFLPLLPLVINAILALCGLFFLKEEAKHKLAD